MNINKSKNNYAITQMILWNKGRVPLKIEDYKVFRKDTDPIEKTPTLKVDGSIIAINSYIDNSYFFELKTSKINDNTVEFRYKDEISYNEGFILNVLTRTCDKPPISKPQLSMILNHKRVRELKKIHSWKYFSFFIFEIIICVGAPIIYLYKGRYLFAAFFIIPLFFAFLFARDVFEQSFNTLPKPLRKNIIR